jgi:hypothetical protein
MIILPAKSNFALAHLVGEIEFRLGVVRIKEGEVRYSVRYDLDFARRHIMNGQEKLARLLRHHNDFCRFVDDLTHHLALRTCRFGQYRMERCDNRHLEAR